MNIIDGVDEIMSIVLGLDKNFQPTDRLIEDLDADELDYSFMQTCIEDDFLIILDEEEFCKCKTVEDVYDIVEKYLK